MNLDSIVFGDVTLFELLWVIFIIIMAVVIAKTININLRRALKNKMDESHLSSINKSVYFVIVIIAFLSVLPILGVDPTGLLVAGGIFAIVLGFASQTVVANLLSGLFLMMERPMKIGDVVKIGEVEGTVEDIRVISTTVRRYNGVYVRIPNEKVFSNDITNYMLNIARRFEYVIPIRYSDDADKAIEVVKKVINEHPMTLVNPPPHHFVEELGDSSVNLIVRIWAPVKDFHWYFLQMELLWKMKTTLEENGIKVPFPQREVWFNSELVTAGKIIEDTKTAKG